jgi:hypothetical protein
MVFANVNYSWLFSGGGFSPRCARNVWSHGTQGFPWLRGRASPSKKAAERALGPAVILRKISHGAQSTQGAICCIRLFTVVSTQRQEGCDVLDLMEKAWIAHHRDGVWSSCWHHPRDQKQNPRINGSGVEE